MGYGLPEQLEQGPERSKGGKGSARSFLKKIARKASRAAWRNKGAVVDKVYKGYEG